MINCLDLYKKVVNINGQFQIYGCTPSALELSYNVFLSSLEQSLSIYNDYRPADPPKLRITTGGWTYTFPGRDNASNFLEYTFQDNPPDVIKSVIPTHLSGLTPPWLYDWWSFNTEKKCFIWQYNKPILSLMYPGRFDVTAIYYHKIMKHLLDPSLATTYVGAKILIHEDDSADTVAQKIAYWINRTFPTVFSAVAIGNTKLRITNLVVGIAGVPNVGNTNWTTNPTIVTAGTPTVAQVVEFTCFPASINFQSKYIMVSSHTTNYYLWFSIDEADGDPKLDNDFLYYIKKEEDRIFYDLISAKFMQSLGQTRSNFGIQNLEILNTGAKMYNDGLARELKAIDELQNKKSKFWLGWK